MRVMELLDEYTKAAREQAQWAIDHNEAIGTMLLAFRGNERVAAVMVGPLAGLDHAQMVIRACVTGFSADVALWVTDTWNSELPDSPISHKPWQRGEMAAVADFYEGREKGWVSDALSLLVVNRAEDTAMATTPYAILPGRGLVWTAPNAEQWGSAQTNVELEGALVDAFKAAMREPVLAAVDEPTVRRMFGIDMDLAMVACDMATASILHQMGCSVILSAKKGGDRQRLLEQADEAGKSGKLDALLAIMQALIDKSATN